ncbi:MAG: DUF4389 domain-containing protein [Solirubrobacterales bacterium]
MSDFPEVNPAPDSSFALPPDSVAYFVDFEHNRSRLTTFFRFLTVIPPMIWLAIYGIGAAVVTIYAWFVLLFTAKFPEGAYGFLASFHRYATKVSAYAFLATDKFPGFSGSPDEPYAAHLLIGPPKDAYSRVKVFFRMILYIPFYIVAYVLLIVAEIVAIVAWFAIVITGKQPKGLQDALNFCLGFVFRVQVWYGLLTEDWPKFSDDEVNRKLAELGYAGTIPPSDGAVAAAPVEPTPPAPPAPPAAPTI